MFSAVVFILVLVHTTSPSTTSRKSSNGPLLEKTICGEPFGPRIVSGDLSRSGEYPWLAALEYVNQLSEHKAVKCSGSVITDRYILTAASCLNPSSANYKLSAVILGEFKLSTDPDCVRSHDIVVFCADPVEKFSIDYVISHPRYSPHSLEHDIALIRVDREIDYSDYIAPICLRSANVPNPKVLDPMDIAGWELFENGPASDMQLRTTIQLRSHNFCREKLSKNITNNQLCAVGDDWKLSSRGNYGGPLMRLHFDDDYQKTRWYQEGVASWGPNCGAVVFTNVAKYSDWIVDTVSQV